METIESPDTKRAERVPAGQRKTDRFPVLHEGHVPIIPLDKWNLHIWGLVPEEKKINFEEFSKLPQTKMHSDIHCVTTWSKLDTNWEGVSAKTIVDLAKPLPTANAVMIHCEGDYTTNLPMEDFLKDDVLFATSYEGEPVTPKHGGPVRLVVPQLYFWKSAKWVIGIEFMPEDKPGFWESRGYHIHGDPWKEERYSKGR